MKNIKNWFIAIILICVCGCGTIQTPTKAPVYCRDSIRTQEERIEALEVTVDTLIYLLMKKDMLTGHWYDHMTMSIYNEQYDWVEGRVVK